MISDYKDNPFYQYAINLKKIYHAYLFEVEDIDASYEMILAFAKMIICKNHFVDNSKCDDCNICNLIDNNTYSNLKIIEPNGATIKKEQILELEKDFSFKSVDGNNQVYIIKEAEKMNLSAANSLLKFIEEPEDGIYGILITTNRKAILETIISRCSLITLTSTKKIDYKKEDIENLSYFLNLMFKQKEASLPYVKQDFLKFYETRDSIIESFNIMEVILDILIKNYYQITDDNFLFYDIIKRNLSDISLDDLVNCLEKVVIYRNKLTNVINLNINLFMDRFIIDVSEVLE